MKTRLALSLALLIGVFAHAVPLEELLEKQPFTIVAPGEYTLTRTVEIDRDVTIILQNGAVLRSDCDPVFRVKSGEFRLEGQGKPARLVCTKKGERGFLTAERGAVFDLNHANGKAPLRFFLRNLVVEGGNGVDGYRLLRDEKGADLTKKEIDEIRVSECHFQCGQKSIAVNYLTLRTARIENCTFEGGDNHIFLNAPMPGGCLIRGNTLRNFGRVGIQIGKGGQIAEGCTTHLPDTIVHDNRLIGGGHGSTLKDSYIHGILIYGNNVSVQGNIVRDVNRGVPVPGARIGQQIVAEDGRILRGKKILWEGKDRRLAGAAIYLKCNRALVQGNICTNSGWRSVIEIKTGGKEYYTSVVNNVVDGSSLAIDESFGFECNAGRSMWAGNMVYNMPNQAFVVRSGYENTFINNVIADAKIGFALSGSAPGEQELIAGNRFINVEYPVALDGKNPPVLGTGTDVLLPSPARLRDNEELPVPGPQWHGRQLVRGDQMFLGVCQDGEYRWMELQGKVLPVPKFKPVGPELMFNSDQSGTDKSEDPALNHPKYPGWTLTCRTAREQQIPEEERGLAPDTTVFQSGGRSLKIVFPTQAAEWRLTQNITLKPGRRYRATAVVKGEEPRNLRLEATPVGMRSALVRAKEDPGWQTLVCDFVMPAKQSKCRICVYGSKTTMGKAAWVDSVSVRELLEEGAPPPPDLVPPEPVGDNLLSDKPRWAPTPAEHKVETTEDGTVRVTVAKNGPVMVTAKVALAPKTAYMMRCEDAAGGSCSAILPGGQKIQGTGGTLVFTTPAAKGATVLRIWISKCKAGDILQIRGVTLHRVKSDKAQ